jgi:hypothetical protein
MKQKMIRMTTRKRAKVLQMPGLPEVSDGVVCSAAHNPASLPRPHEVDEIRLLTCLLDSRQKEEEAQVQEEEEGWRQGSELSAASAGLQLVP